MLWRVAMKITKIREVPSCTPTTGTDKPPC